MESKKIDFGVKALIINDSKYLAVHKAGIKDWKYELPGGRISFGETVEETLIREVKEELNLVVKPIRLIDTWNYINDDNTKQVVGVIYYCEVLNTLENIKLSNEHTDFKWFNIGDISSMNILFDHKMKKWDWQNLI